MFKLFYFKYDFCIDDTLKKLYESHVNQYAPLKRINMHDMYEINGNHYFVTKAYAPEHIEVTLKKVENYAK